MVAQETHPVEERIVQLLRHLGIEKAHAAAYLPGDWSGLLERHPSAVASLTLICPRGMKTEVLRPHAGRLLIVSGDGGNTVADLRRAVHDLPGATVTMLRDYFSPMWADVMADRTGEVTAAMSEFLSLREKESPLPPVRLPRGEGEEAGISYTVRGSGPPLLLFPLGLAASQWEPLLPALSEGYTTITLGGPYLGMVAFLETRGPGYLRVVRGVVDEVGLQPGQRVLEVGCGAGTVARWLARYTGKRNPIVGADINPYLLREAGRLAVSEGLGDIIEWQSGNGEELPFADGRFDATMAFTVMEEGDADAMLAQCAPGHPARRQGRGDCPFPGHALVGQSAAAARPQAQGPDRLWRRGAGRLRRCEPVRAHGADRTQGRGHVAAVGLLRVRGAAATTAGTHGRAVESRGSRGVA